MPIVTSVLVLTYEDGNVTRIDVLNSMLIKFERHFKRPYVEGSVIDGATMTYYVAHEQNWPESDEQLDEFIDSVRFKWETPDNGARPTPAPQAPS